jgi:hypothetical protein
VDRSPFFLRRGAFVERTQQTDHLRVSHSRKCLCVACLKKPFGLRVTIDARTFVSPIAGRDVDATRRNLRRFPLRTECDPCNPQDRAADGNHESSWGRFICSWR